MNRLIILFGIIALSIPVYADTILFKDDLTLECDVVKITDKEITVRISKGTFTFPKDRIKKIDYNFEKRKSMIPDDDYAAHYDLGLWAFSCEEYDKALSQFLYCEGKKGIPDELLLKTAEIYEKRNDTENAVKYLNKYLDKHKDDEAVKKHLEELVKKAEEPGNKTVSSMKQADEGMEILKGWLIEKWGNPGKITPSKGIHDSTENHVLKVEYDAKGEDKTAVRIQAKMDLTDKKTCTADIYNPENRAISFALAFVTSPGYAWYESKTQPIKPGWNLNVSFDLTARNFKSKETNWNHTTDIKNKANTSQFILLIYNGRRTGTLYFDNIRLNK